MKQRYAKVDGSIKGIASKHDIPGHNLRVERSAHGRENEIGVIHGAELGGSTEKFGEKVEVLRKGSGDNEGMDLF